MCPICSLQTKLDSSLISEAFKSVVFWALTTLGQARVAYSQVLPDAQQSKKFVLINDNIWRLVMVACLHPPNARLAWPCFLNGRERTLGLPDAFNYNETNWGCYVPSSSPSCMLLVQLATHRSMIFLMRWHPTKRLRFTCFLYKVINCVLTNFPHSPRSVPTQIRDM